MQSHQGHFSFPKSRLKTAFLTAERLIDCRSKSDSIWNPKYFPAPPVDKAKADASDYSTDSSINAQKRNINEKDDKKTGCVKWVDAHSTR